MMTLEEAIKHCKDVALSCTNKECALEHFQLLKWLQEYSNMLEKQGEQKPTIKMISAEESLGIDSATYNKIVDECIYGEQKLADKVEPKFHKGDWIASNVCNSSDLLRIIDIDGKDYEVETPQGNTGVPSIAYVDSNFHLWTIQDAKDGDVLVSCNCIFIFNKIDNNWVKVHCNLHKDDSLIFENYGLMTLKYKNGIFPATKEQRDKLEKAMFDAGYKWNKEERKLEKI